jgi:hypothetical protein
MIEIVPDVVVITNSKGIQWYPMYEDEIDLEDF